MEEKNLLLYYLKQGIFFCVDMIGYQGRIELLFLECTRFTMEETNLPLYYHKQDIILCRYVRLLGKVWSFS
jgi:hypothetical protein